MESINILSNKMEKINQVMKIIKDHERRLKVLENTRERISAKSSVFNVDWYKPGSTIDKVLKLVSEGFLNKPKNLTDIIAKFEEKDFHLKASDLTLPLRKIVRKNLLRKTKKLPNGNVSKNWLYIKE